MLAVVIYDLLRFPQDGLIGDGAAGVGITHPWMCAVNQSHQAGSGSFTTSPRELLAFTIAECAEASGLATPGFCPP